MMLVCLFLSFLLGASQSTHLGKDRSDTLGNPDKLRENHLAETTNQAQEKETAKSPDLTGDAYYKKQLVPLCWQNTTCKEAGGFCYSYRYSKCDYLVPEFCSGFYGVSCSCCIDCYRSGVNSNCHKNGGICTKIDKDDNNCTCPNPEDYLSLHDCPASGCGCCLPCKTTPGCSKCVRDPKPFLDKGYTLDEEVRCEEKECVCVQDPCHDHNGVCTQLKGECLPNQCREECSRKSVVVDCLCGEKCFCCVPPCVTGTFTGVLFPSKG